MPADMTLVQNYWNGTVRDQVPLINTLELGLAVAASLPLIFGNNSVIVENCAADATVLKKKNLCVRATTDSLYDIQA